MKKKFLLWASCIVVLLLAAGTSFAGTTELVSVDSNGYQADDHSRFPSISADGRYVAFESYATNLVPGILKVTKNIFLRDRATGLTEILNINSNGEIMKGWSSQASISANGRYVAFFFSANPQMGITNSSGIYVRDRAAGLTERVDVNSSGKPSNEYSDGPSISADGRYVAFESYATNLVPGDTNGAADIFVRDRAAGKTERVNVGSSGNQANGHGRSPSLSADGRYVAFNSRATNLVPNDTNGEESDIFVHDRVSGVTELVSIDSSGNPSNGYSKYSSLSADGRYVAFSSLATNLVPGGTNDTRHIFVHDRMSGVTELVSVNSNGNQGNSYSGYPSISADGSRVAFSSTATNLAPGNINVRENVFVRDRVNGMTELVSVDSNGNHANGSSEQASISADGNHVAFSSWATNLVPGDTNGKWDIFVNMDCSVDASCSFCTDNDLDGYSVEGGTCGPVDCNDNDRQIHPYAEEACNDGIDSNCDGQENDGCPVYTYYEDADADLFGNALSIITSLLPQPPSGYVSDNGDCDDGSGEINPAAQEVCNDGVDNNCDGLENEGCPIYTYHEDADADLFGNTLGIINSTLPYPPSGYVIDNTDCNDGDPAINPGATEVPYNGVDENCNGMADDDDLDSDGFGISADCNDGDPAINPGAQEIKHDGTDQNCNGHDLTIDITIKYKAKKDRLTVKATSGFGAAAGLVLAGYGVPMTWNGELWKAVVEPAGGKPAFVTVSGIEGSETAAVE